MNRRLTTFFSSVRSAFPAPYWFAVILVLLFVAYYGVILFSYHDFAAFLEASTIWWVWLGVCLVLLVIIRKWWLKREGDGEKASPPPEAGPPSASGQSPFPQVIAGTVLLVVVLVTLSYMFPVGSGIGVKKNNIKKGDEKKDSGGKKEGSANGGSKKGGYKKDDDQGDGDKAGSRVPRLTNKAFVILAALCLLALFIAVFYFIEVSEALKWGLLKRLNTVPVPTISPLLCFSGPYAWKNSDVADIVTPDVFQLYSTWLFSAGILFILYWFLYAVFGYASEIRRKPEVMPLADGPTPDDSQSDAERKDRWMIRVCLAMAMIGAYIYLIVVVDAATRLANG